MAKKANNTKTVSSPTIETHKEIFLAKAAGEDVVLPDPITHEEIWLKKIAEKPAGSQVVANPTLEGTEAALTGLKVDETKYAVPQPTNVVANPTLEGTEAALTGLEVGDTKYAVPQGTNVVANPTMAGGEAALTGLQVGDTKYAINSGSKVYTHHIKIYGYQQGSFINECYAYVVNNSATPFTASTLVQYIKTVGAIMLNGYQKSSGTKVFTRVALYLSYASNDLKAYFMELDSSTIKTDIYGLSVDVTDTVKTL